MVLYVFCCNLENEKSFHIAEGNLSCIVEEPIRLPSQVPKMLYGIASQVQVATTLDDSEHSDNEDDDGVRAVPKIVESKESCENDATLKADVVERQKSESLVEKLITCRQKSITDFVLAGGENVRAHAATIGANRGFPYILHGFNPRFLTPAHQLLLNQQKSLRMSDFTITRSAAFAKLYTKRLNTVPLSFEWPKSHRGSERMIPVQLIRFDSLGALVVVVFGDGIIVVYDFDECQFRVQRR